MRVGVTGHQQLEDPTAWLWVKSVIRNELARIASPLVGVTSLAVGADQIFARLVLERGGALYAVLPFANIERSFPPEHIESFKELASQATIEVLDTPGTDEDAYFAAGKRVVDLSHIMLAVWDGEPAKGKGGTADVVAYTIGKNVPLIHINPLSRTIQQTTGLASCRGNGRPAGRQRRA
jgi:hypothetical protein